MEWFSVEMLTALLVIIGIDLVLAGDNAIVIGMAARNVPKESQKKVVFLGTAGAIIIRIIGTLIVSWLLAIPGLLFIGGLMLLWISYKLLTDKGGHEIEAKSSVAAAIKTIVIADAVMGLDNIIAVAGAAHGNFWLVVIGLLISVPIIVWGSTLFITLIERFPVIIYIGAAILTFTAAKMIVGESFIKPYFDNNPVAKYSFVALLIVAVLAIGKIKQLNGNTVKMNGNGDLSLPADLVHEANINLEDTYVAKIGDDGKLQLTKSDKLSDDARSHSAG
ncbi:TerC family protein [Paenibacillus sp. N1-5-1-14]|uniref:TerC family protein n=1 Tax=Paenibacillus radicibacter TaxID=2972488 RepID=UPI002159948E|nr:TerC family protein [Paenibacillus radicibacter]MCR8643877.1 TerC family protein [Paenibacillus radicibacter]